MRRKKLYFLDGMKRNSLDSLVPMEHQSLSKSSMTKEGKLTRGAAAASRRTGERFDGGMDGTDRDGVGSC